MQAKGKFEIKHWDENPYDEVEGERKFTRAAVTQAYSGDIEGEGKVTYLMAYGDDGSASFVGQERIIGRLGERAGSFVLHGSGAYDGGTARCEWHVVPGSGTGELAGLRGTGGYAAGHGMSADFTLDYEFA